MAQAKMWRFGMHSKQLVPFGSGAKGVYQESRELGAGPAALVRRTRTQQTLSTLTYPPSWVVTGTQPH